MPRYTNTNTEDVVLPGGARIPANGGIFDTEVFYPTVPAGVTVNEAIKLTNPVKLSQAITGSSGDTTIAIPDELTGDYTVMITCIAGQAEIYLNTKTGITPKIVGAGMSWGIKCKSRTVDSVIITILAGSTSVVVDAFSTM